MIYKLEVTSTEIALIGQGLDLLPHGRVSKLFARIQQQITIQEQEKSISDPESSKQE